jgi:hypothetical protein
MSSLQRKIKEPKKGMQIKECSTQQSTHKSYMLSIIEPLIHTFTQLGTNYFVHAPHLIKLLKMIFLGIWSFPNKPKHLSQIVLPYSNKQFKIKL